MKMCGARNINRCQILDLPLVLLYDILCRLTVDAIFSCKCVCKTFLEILTDPYTASELYNLVISISSTCNGLLCICYMNPRFEMIYYICNPILGEFFPLPPHVQNHLEHSAFGFCPKTKQYKVIGFGRFYRYCEICTVGVDRCWRKIDYLPFPRFFFSFDSCPNGNLHWITRSCTVSNLICSFNLETEQFSYIPPPAHLTQDMLNEVTIFKIGLLDGLFCFSYMIGPRYEAFVMKDYGVKGCWIRQLSVDLFSNFNLRGRLTNAVINFLDNGDLFIRCIDGTLVCCNLWTGTTTNMIVQNVWSYCDVLSFVPSFISLKEIAAAAGADVEVVRRKMGRNLWSENGFQFIR